jgi:ubiquinone/menaquinone biosynthesis C-methylase UbiE
MGHNIYQWSAKYYDNSLNSAIISVDIQFYISKLKGNEKVLEIGCGIGRVAIALANHCNRITGIDVSDEMLVEFRKKLNGGKINIEIKNANMVDFVLNKRFDLAIFPFRSLNLSESCGFKIQAVSRDWNSMPYSDLESGGEMIFELSVL